VNACFIDLTPASKSLVPALRIVPSLAACCLTPGPKTLGRAIILERPTIPTFAANTPFALVVTSASISASTSTGISSASGFAASHFPLR